MQSGADKDGVLRPLDGDNDGTATVNMGCYEYLNRDADSDGSSMTDGREYAHEPDSTDSSDQYTDPDTDSFNNKKQYIAGTEPRNASSFFHITNVAHPNSFSVAFLCANSRVYSGLFPTNLVDGERPGVAGQTNVTGDVSGETSLTDAVDTGRRSYCVRVLLP